MQVWGRMGRFRLELIWVHEHLSTKTYIKVERISIPFTDSLYF